MTTTDPSALWAAAQGLLAVLSEPFVSPTSRTWLPALGIAAVGALLISLHRRDLNRRLTELPSRLRSPSSRLDLQLLLGGQLLGWLVGGSSLSAVWVATHLVRRMDAVLGSPPPLAVPGWALTLGYSAVLFVAWDLSRFLLHLALHRVPLLWRFHQVHHSASTLTPLTYHRTHPVEALLYALRGALVTGLVSGLAFYLFRGQAQIWTLMGVPAAGLMLNAVMGNLRHSELWLPFPDRVERWLISPAQHQLHHSIEPRHRDRNLGTWLAIWDRAAGTLLVSEAPPSGYGVSNRNHGDDLISAWLGPFRGMLSPLPVLALALISSRALAQESPGGEPQSSEGEAPSSSDDSDSSDVDDSGDSEPLLDEPGLRMIVRGDQGTPRVAGSAQSLDEEDLELFEYDDIQRVLSAQVPGVSTRTEDGYGLRPNIGIRGVNSERSSKVSLMEDGVLLAPAPYAAPAAYYFPMSTRMVGMEVFKGPVAIRYGPNTVGGALNLITRPVPTEGFDGQLDLGAGLYQTGKLHAWAGYGGERWGVLGEVAHLQSGGFKELDDGGPTGFSHSEAMLKVAFRPDHRQQWQLKLGYTTETSHETYTGLNAADYADTPYRRYLATSADLMHFQRGQAELSHSLQRGGWKVRTVGAVHALDRSWSKLDGFEEGPALYDLLKADATGGQAQLYMAVLRGEEDSGEDIALAYGTRDRQYLSTSLQSTARTMVVGDRFSQQIEVGVRLHVDQVWRTHTTDFYGVESGALTALGRDTRLDQDSYAQARALAVHVTDDMRFGDLHLIPGVRLEAVQSLKHELADKRPDPTLRVTPLPGMAALYEHNSWWSSFAGVHRGFTPVAPGQAEEVKPEVSWNYEAGVRFHQGPTQLEVVGFFNDYSNLTGQCSVSGGCLGDQVELQYNGGAVFVQGGELAARHDLYLPAEWVVPVEATYTYTHTRFRTAFVSDFPQFGSVQIGDSLPYLPRHQASARVGLRRGRVHVAGGAMYRGAMLDEAGAWPPSESADVPAQLLVDATVHLQATERLEVYAVGSNLLNDQSHTSWRPVGLRPSAPRQVMLGVKVSPRKSGASLD